MFVFFVDPFAKVVLLNFLKVANDGLAGDENESQDQESGSGMTSSIGINSRSQTVSGGYCDISVPVYATVKGVSPLFASNRYIPKC